MEYKVQIKLPQETQLGRFIGKGGAKKSELENDLKDVFAKTGMSSAKLSIKVETVKESSRNSVTLQISALSVKPPDALIAFLMGRIKARLLEACAISDSDLQVMDPTFAIESNVALHSNQGAGSPANTSSEVPYKDSSSTLQDDEMVALWLRKESATHKSDLDEGEDDDDDDAENLAAEPELGPRIPSAHPKSNELLRAHRINPQINLMDCWRPFHDGPQFSIKTADISCFDAQLKVLISLDSGEATSASFDFSPLSSHYEVRITAPDDFKVKVSDQSSPSFRTFVALIHKAFQQAIALSTVTIALAINDPDLPWHVRSCCGHILISETINFCREKSSVHTADGSSRCEVVLLDKNSTAVGVYKSELSSLYGVACGLSPFAAAVTSTCKSSTTCIEDERHHDELQCIGKGGQLTGMQTASSAPKPAARSGRQECYDATSGFRGRDEATYMGAGILFVRVNAGQIEVLLCIERRIGEGVVLMVLGGKRDHAEVPMRTAVREFVEETAKIATQEEVHTALCGEGARRLWIGFGGYVLYVARADDFRAKLDHLPELYNNKYFKPFSAEADHLVWVPWNRICAALSTARSESRATVNIRVSKGAGTIAVPVSKFLQRLSSLPMLADAITSAARQGVLDKENFKKRVLTEIESTRKLLGLPDEDQASAILGKDWRLRMESPPLPDHSAFVDLKPSDPKYQAVMAKLPQDYARRVIGVRSIQVATRQAEFAEVREVLKAELIEVKDLFHGTPERWRATAIAINGFSTSIVLHGRALGDGVYTSEDPSICQGYAKQAGSILCLKGLITSKTVKNPPVYVFRQAEHLLPVMIADVAASGEDEQKVMKESETAHKEAKKRMEEEDKQFQLKELKFKVDAIQRWKASAAFFIERVQERLKDFAKVSAATSGSKDDESELWPQLMMDIDREIAQFKSRLPIYSHKERILRALQLHDIIILTASTGSGKSTQIPQYLLDEVFCGPAGQNERRIAVLQPRRVNAISLAARVSSERGGEVGGEVGYRLGRGDSMACDDTRVEFMTHGLFVQLGQDPGRLLKRYSAVILDEAHERSMDIDLSLGLLRKALEVYAASDATGRAAFKVIVMSATISPEQVSMFREHLNPSNALACDTLDLPGNSFPVRIVYRGDMEPDAAVIGSKGVGSVMGDYATEIALDLLQRTTSGHILVFMPGESNIARAVQSAKLLMRKKLEKEEQNRRKIRPWWDIFGFGEYYQNSDEDLQSKGTGFSVQIHLDSDTIPKQGEGMQRPKSVKVRVGFYPFHGKLSGAERDRILKPQDERLVIFATNVAETGLTIPNVRYVIDTGLERRVKFNPITGIPEMLTVPISKSSMEQRAGRAGRVASGVCVRLFSEESAAQRPVSDPLEIEDAPVLGAALRLVSIGDQIVLPNPMGSDVMATAMKSLQLLGAVDENGDITSEIGKPLLKFGMDLRLGRFLLACARAGCIEHGVRLAAVLATDGHQRLLPQRANKKVEKKVAQGIANRLGNMLDESGDHVTIVRMVLGFEKSKGTIEWCKKHGLDYFSLIEANRAKAYILEVLVQLKLGLKNDQGKIDAAGGWERALLRSLCAANFDQLAVAQTPGESKDGFIRLLDENAKSHAVSSVSKFAAECGKPAGAVDLGIDPSILQKLQQTKATDPQPTGPVDVRVSLVGASALWTIEKLDAKHTPSTAVAKVHPNSRSLVVFSSAMLTDAQPNKPQISMVSYVTPEDIEEGAPSWCREAGFGELYDKNVRIVEEFYVPPNACKLLLEKHGSWLACLRRKFPCISASFEREKNILRCSAPESIMPLIEARLGRLLQQVAEDVAIDIPDGADMGKFIGKGGEHRVQLEGELKQLAKEAGADPDGVQLIIETTNKHGKNAVKLRVQGDAKAIVGVLIGRIRTSLCETIGVALPELRLAVGGGQAAKLLQSNPRLMQLATSVQPTGLRSRDEAMLQLAHAAVWQCRCPVYGGFVRDWVIRGIQAEDIDVLVEPGNLDRVVAALKGAAAARGLRLCGQRNKGAAFALTFADPSSQGKPIDVDLVDRSKLPHIAPGVDANIDNIMVGVQGQLVLKVPTAARSTLPLTKCIRHAQRGRFVFFYQLRTDAPPTRDDPPFRRLDKLLSKGFVCLSAVPDVVLQALPAARRQLVQPKPKYSLQWWAGAS